MPHPFVHTFSQAGSYYVYDVNTNAVLEVDQLLFELVSIVDLVEVGEACKAEISDASLKHISAQFSIDAINSALQTIEQANIANGLFSTRRLPAIDFPYTKDQVALLYDQIVRQVILCVTEQCNLKCKYCAYSGTYKFNRVHSNKAMSPSRALEAMKFLVEHSSYIIRNTDEELTLSFYGGEPLLNMAAILACFDRLETEYKALRGRLSFGMTTNLTTETAPILDSLAEHNVELLVSLDGPESIHDRYRLTADGHGSFRRTLENLHRLERAHPSYYRDRVSFSTVLHPPYDVEAVIEFFEHTDLVRNHSVVFSLVDSADTTFFDTHLRPEEHRTVQVARLREVFVQRLKAGTCEAQSPLMDLLGGKLKKVVRRPMHSMSKLSYPSGACLPGLQRTFVGVDGSLYMCEKINDKLPIGRLDTGYDIDAIWTLMKEYIAMSEDMCSDCWAFRFCSLCFATSLKGPALSNKRRSALCGSIRAEVSGALATYCDLMNANETEVLRAFPNPTSVDTFALASQCIQYLDSGGAILADPPKVLTTHNSI